MHAKLVEQDVDSGARIYVIGADERAADNIYGEQPYSDLTGRWIAIRYYPDQGRPGGISVIDLRDGSRRDVLVGKPPFPAFHAWGEHLYYHQVVDGTLMLRRCRYDSLAVENIAPLPSEMGLFSYGTVSPDQRYYAVSVRADADTSAAVHVLDLQTGKWRLLLDKPGYHAKHEQFSRDGRNCVLIQLNRMPAVNEVLLAECAPDGPPRLFPADRPHTPRPTGHEAWIGTGASIFFSTSVDEQSRGNIWMAETGQPGPQLVCPCERRFGHVSVSRCGRYWIGDTDETGIPIYIGTFGTATCRRVVYSRTVYDGKQWSHTHPYLTADNQWLIFTSTRGGHPQVYAAKLQEGWL